MQIEVLLPAWGIDPAEVTDIQQMGDNVRSLTLSNGRKLILKHVWDDLNDARLTADCDLHAHLYEQGIPVAVPLVTRNGTHWLRAENQRYTLSPSLLANFAGLDSSDTSRNIGRSIARLHASLATWPHKIESWTYYMPTRIFDECIPRCREQLSGDQLMRFETALARFEPEAQELLDPGQLTRLHGDCHGGNLLINDGMVSGFIDIDHLPLGPRLFDVAYYLADRAKNALRENNLPGNWRETVNGVWTGYDEIAHWTTFEKKSLWHMIAGTQMLFVEVFAVNKNESHLLLNLKLFEWLTAQPRDSLLK